MTGKTLHQKPDSKDSRRLSASLESPEDWLVGLNGSPAALSSEGLEVWRERWRPRLTVFISEPDLPQPLQITAPAWRLAAFQPRQAPGTSTSLNPCREASFGTGSHTMRAGTAGADLQHHARFIHLSLALHPARSVSQWQTGFCPHCQKHHYAKGVFCHTLCLRSAGCLSARVLQSAFCKTSPRSCW